MPDFDKFKESVLGFIRRKPILAIITAIIIFFFIVALAVLFIQSSKPKQKSYEKQDIVLDSVPLMPNGPEIEKEYYPSRTTQNKWADEDARQWLTEPGQEMTKELERSNNNIIKGITGAAP